MLCVHLLLSCTETKDPRQKVQAVKKLIQQLPQPNLDTMKFLFRHLQKYVHLHLKMSSLLTPLRFEKYFLNVVFTNWWDRIL